MDICGTHYRALTIPVLVDGEIVASCPDCVAEAEAEAATQAEVGA